MLVLSENDVSKLLDIPSAIQRIDEAFRELDQKKVISPGRLRILVPGSSGSIRLMPAVLQESKASGLKVLTGTAGKRRAGQNYFLIILVDFDDGAVKCIMSAERLTQLRTGAVSAVATMHLARKDAKTIGIIGAGVQGQGQLEAICSVLKPEGGYVFDLYPETAKKLSKFAKENLGVDLEVVGDVRAAAKADVLATATTSSAPILDSSMIHEGTHINAIGSNLPSRKELDISILKSAKVIVDSQAQAIEESGDLEPFRDGTLSPNSIYAELSEIVGGSKQGRTSDSEITVFKSVGIALQDIATAELLYERALQRGLGTTIQL